MKQLGGSFALLALVVLACSSDETAPVDGSGGRGGGAHAGGGGTGAGAGASAGNGGDGGEPVNGGGYTPTPIVQLVGLESVTFYERSGGAQPTAYTFSMDGDAINGRLPDPLSPMNSDIAVASGELYDVYYSDADGAYAGDGQYLTISGEYDQTAPAEGGLNLAEVTLDFQTSQAEHGNYVASYVALGDNQDPSSVDQCIDGDLQTHAAMGNTVGAGERLRLTIGFLSTSGPAE